MINTYTTEQAQVLQKAVVALKEHSELKSQLRASEDRLSKVSREYGDAYRIWGFRPEHLRQACVARGFIT